MENENKVVAFRPRELPDYAALHHDPDVAFKNDQLQLLLSKPPSKKWIKKHPMINVKDKDGDMVPLKYIPVDKVKYLLTIIFQNWKNEILNVQQIFNGIVVTVRLHYQHPLTGEWSYKDGVGGVGIQTDKGASASDLGAIKFDAVMKAAPAAESYALKNAAEKLGAIFGSELNNWNPAEFKPMYMEGDGEPESKQEKKEAAATTSPKVDEDDDLPL